MNIFNPIIHARNSFNFNGDRTHTYHIIGTTKEFFLRCEAPYDCIFGWGAEYNICVTQVGLF